MEMITSKANILKAGLERIEHCIHANILKACFFSCFIDKYIYVLMKRAFSFVFLGFLALKVHKQTLRSINPIGQLC